MEDSVTLRLFDFFKKILVCLSTFFCVVSCSNAKHVSSPQKRFSLTEALELGMELEERATENGKIIYLKFDNFDFCVISNPTIFMTNEKDVSFSTHITEDPFGRYKLQVRHNSNFEMFLTFVCKERLGFFNINLI